MARGIAVYALAILLLTSLLPAQTITTITQSGLGFPVPIPVDSLTEVDGFRTYDSLRARHLSLTLANPAITAHTVGISYRGRDIVAYKFTNPESDYTPEGFPKGGAFIQGGIHAREWVSPEATTALFEWLAQEGQQDPVAAYLLDHMVIVISPLSNPDGFLQTQRDPTRVVDGTESGSGGRDGRMRRKNMRDADEALETLEDYLSGVDLNRNYSVGFGSGSSAQPDSITYRGTAPFSEPETIASRNAMELLPQDRFRFGVDVHSFGQYFIPITTTSQDRNSALTACTDAMRASISAVSGLVYTAIYTNASTQAIGATDEYIAGTYGALSWTLEIRPSSSQNGFILPDNQAATMRREVLAALRTGLYYASGPAFVKAVEVWGTENDGVTPTQLLHRQMRRPNTEQTQRELVTEIAEELQIGGRYLLAIRYSKPMRLVDPATGSVSRYRIEGHDHPTITGSFLSDVQSLGWSPFVFPQLAGTYEGDTVWFSFTPPAGLTPNQPIQLLITDTDLVLSTIDGNPLISADWSPNGWTGWDAQGTDSLTFLSFSAAKTGNNWRME